MKQGPQPQLTNELEASRPMSPLMLTVLTVLLGGSFFFSELDWKVSTYEHYALPPEDAEALVTAGNSGRKAAYVLIGLLGCGLLVVPARQKLKLSGMPALLIGGYYLTCLASIGWSDDPGLTVKRVAVLSFCLLGILGMVRHLAPRDVLNVTLGLAVVGLVNEMALQGKRVLTGFQTKDLR